MFLFSLSLPVGGFVSIDCRVTAVLKYKKILPFLTRHILRCESPRLVSSPPGAILSQGASRRSSRSFLTLILTAFYLEFRDISNLPFLFACFCYFPLSEEICLTAVSAHVTVLSACRQVPRLVCPCGSPTTAIIFGIHSVSHCIVCCCRFI